LIIFKTHIENILPLIMMEAKSEMGGKLEKNGTSERKLDGRDEFPVVVDFSEGMAQMTSEFTGIVTQIHDSLNSLTLVEERGRERKEDRYNDAVLGGTTPSLQDLLGFSSKASDLLGSLSCSEVALIIEEMDIIVNRAVESELDKEGEDLKRYKKELKQKEQWIIQKDNEMTIKEQELNLKEAQLIKNSEAQSHQLILVVNYYL
jgi:hypothetical protein